jgi:hypothetical protein
VDRESAHREAGEGKEELESGKWPARWGNHKTCMETRLTLKKFVCMRATLISTWKSKGQPMYGVEIEHLTKHSALALWSMEASLANFAYECPSRCVLSSRTGQGDD